MQKYFADITLKEVQEALESRAMQEYDSYFTQVRARGDAIIQEAREEHKPIMVLAGRPYHVDPEINHGIDKLICSLRCGGDHARTASAPGENLPRPACSTSGPTTPGCTQPPGTSAASTKDMNLVQLVSFGCGMDAITTDEVRAHFGRPRTNSTPRSKSTRSPIWAL